ncbi:hypothetical protein Lal_00021495 [Lupinus albus]|nr:hypothetical protein Lal_00021495 [Lupinus albus]
MTDIVVIGGNEERSKGWRKSQRKLVKLLENDSNAHQDMTSSASSPNTIQPVIPTTKSVRAKSDPTWDHCQLVQDVNGKKIKHQLKEYLNQVSGSRKRGTNQIRSEEDANEENMNPPIAAKAKGKTNTLDFAPRTTPGAQPSIKMGFAGKDDIRKADLAIARFFYDCCIPFNCSNSVYYQLMINAIAAIGPGYKGPTYYAIRSNLLHEMKNEVELLVENFRNFWKEFGCTIIADGDIGKMDHVSTLAKSASDITKFVYNHGYLLAWLRKRQGWKEIIRPGATCFATTFIVVKNIHEHKHDLQALVTSKYFIDSRYYRDKKVNRFVEVVMNTRFWNDCAIIVNIVAPLIRLLRIVDADERPSLPYVYDWMCRARKTIKNVFMNKKSLYKPYTRIVKQRWDKQLRTKLHCVADFLNPTFYYDMENFCIKQEVQQDWLDVLQAKVTTSKTEFFKQSCIYHDKVGSFGNTMAIETVKHLQPGMVEEQNIAIDGELNLDFFPQEDVDS